MDNRKPHSEIQCSQFEALLAEALEGQLPEEIRQPFETHYQSCPICGPMFAEAQEGMEWLRGLQDLAPPANLIHNILAATSVAAAEEQRAKTLGGVTGWLRSAWNSVRLMATGTLQPRFVTSFAMAFFSLTLTLSLAGVRIKDLANLDLRPSSVKKAVVLEFTQVEAKVVKYYDNLRFVVEIQTRVRELRKAASSPENDQKPTEQQKQDKNRDNDTSGRPERHDDYSRELDNSVIAYTKSSHEGASL
ncbi:MAG TPA: zf-HC2 domain-containing protein [Candidatus Angelobacter sp.]|jgi:hypothetical protein|nr:zf-HC2 domain-containing protein [Candidatus Angelobacter sp.]